VAKGVTIGGSKLRRFNARKQLDKVSGGFAQPWLAPPLVLRRRSMER
jgi:hypothetical protein